MRKPTSAPEIIDDIYEGILDPEAWDRAMQAIMALVGATGQLCISLNPETGRVYRQHITGYDPADVADYHDNWVTKDPRIRLSLEAPSDTIVTEHSLMPFRTFSRSEVFNEFLKPNHVPWIMAIWLEKGGDRQTYFSLQGASDRNPFDPEECARLRMIARHLRRSLDVQDRLLAEHFTTTAVLQGLDQNRFGAVLLDDAARIIEVSDTAARLLTRADALEVSTATGSWLSESLRCRLRALMADRPEGGHLNGSNLTVASPENGTTLSLVLSPALQYASSWFGRHARWLLIVFDADRPDEASAESIRSEFGLTQAEARVAHLLAQGLVPKQIAAHCGTSPETVRTQIKSVYRKLDVHSRTALLSRVLGGEP